MPRVTNIINIGNNILKIFFNDKNFLEIYESNTDFNHIDFIRKTENQNHASDSNLKNQVTMNGEIINIEKDGESESYYVASFGGLIGKLDLSMIYEKNDVNIIKIKYILHNK